MRHLYLTGAVTALACSMGSSAGQAQLTAVIPIFEPSR